MYISIIRRIPAVLNEKDTKILQLLQLNTAKIYLVFVL